MPSRTYDLEALRRLPVDQRLRLVEELWGSIADDAADDLFPLTPELRREMKEGLEEYHRDPRSAKTLDQRRSNGTRRNDPVSASGGSPHSFDVRGNSAPSTRPLSKPGLVTVAGSANDDLAVGTLRSIFRQAGLEP